MMHVKATIGAVVGAAGIMLAEEVLPNDWTKMPVTLALIVLVIYVFARAVPNILDNQREMSKEAADAQIAAAKEHRAAVDKVCDTNSQNVQLLLAKMDDHAEEHKTAMERQTDAMIAAITHNTSRPKNNRNRNRP